MVRGSLRGRCGRDDLEESRGVGERARVAGDCELRDVDIGSLDIDIASLDIDIGSLDIDIASLDIDIGSLDIDIASLDNPQGARGRKQAGQAAPDRVASPVVAAMGKSEILEQRRATAPGEAQVSLARLPVTGRELFGREKELAWLDACWRDGVHVVSIVAWGGVGKSALVNRWLADLRDDGWRGAERVFVWSFYSQGTDRLASSDEFFAVALRKFGDREAAPRSPWEKGERLAELVRKERAILVLDGLEALQWGPGVQQGRLKDRALAALIKELAALNQGLCLVTSRLAVADLDGLAGKKVQEQALGPLSAAAGAALLASRGVKGTDDELQQTASEYKGHGLALKLLSSYLVEVAQGDVTRRRKVGPLLLDEQMGGHARRVMAAYERWLAGKPELAILLMLGLFDRPAAPDEIAALRAEPPVPGLTDGLYDPGPRRHWCHWLFPSPRQPLSESRWQGAVTKLRQLGLIEVDHTGRLDAHPLVREHFGERLQATEPEAWRAGHQRLYVYLKGKAKELPETVEEMAPLYAAVVHGCMAGKNQEALDEVHFKRIRRGGEAFSVRELGALGSEAAVLSAYFDPPWERFAPGLGEPDQAWVLNAAGFALRALGRLPEATALLRLGVEARVAQQNWRQAAVATTNLAELLQTRGELRDAEATARDSVALADRSGNAFRRLYSRTTLAAALHALGHREAAGALFEQAERMQKEWQPESPLLYSLQGFRYCDLLLEQDREAAVRARASQALRIAQHNRGLLDIALNHLSLGRTDLLTARRSARFRVQSPNFDQAVLNLRRAGDQTKLPLGLLARADLHIHTRALPEARHDLTEALTLSQRIGARLHECDAHLGLARLALAEHDREAALRHHEAARKLVEQTSYHRRDAALAALSAEAAALPPALPPPPPPPAIEPPLPPRPAMTTQHDPDLAVIIALPEELRELLALVPGYTAHDSADLNAYLFTHAGYRCAVSLVGRMGQTQAATIAAKAIAAFDPPNLLSLGIAAGLHDLRIGDVHVPPQAVEYLQDAKAVPDGPGAYTIVPGAPAYQADYALHNAVVGLEFRHPAAHQAFREACRADLASLVDDAEVRAKLLADKVIRPDAGILTDGHVATGPVVGAAPAFAAWVRSHDRNVKSLEMESAAVLLAAQTRAEPKRALVIRGISDAGDEHKQARDAVGKGALRKYAMRNAVRLLFALLETGAFPHRPR